MLRGCMFVGFRTNQLCANTHSKKVIHTQYCFEKLKFMSKSHNICTSWLNIKPVYTVTLRLTWPISCARNLRRFDLVQYGILSYLNGIFYDSLTYCLSLQWFHSLSDLLMNMEYRGSFFSIKIKFGPQPSYSCL